MTSEFVTVRNAIEAVFQAKYQAAVAFVHAIEADAKAQAPGDLATAFADAESAFLAAPGAFQARAFVALEVFATTLLGEAVSIVKKDAASLTTSATPAS